MKMFVRARRGATSTEYGLVAALIAVAVIAAVGGLGKSIYGSFFGVIMALVMTSDGAPPPDSAFWGAAMAHGDTSGDGAIQPDEWAAFANQYGIASDPGEINAMFAAADGDGDGSLSESELAMLPEENRPEE